jgi:hypothetical protein
MMRTGRRQYLGSLKVCHDDTEASPSRLCGISAIGRDLEEEA